MVPQDEIAAENGDGCNDDRDVNTDHLVASQPTASLRGRYPGALAFNIAAFILPALYGTLAKL